MLRIMVLALVALVGVELPYSAKASTVTYDLTLTDLSGQQTGAGTLVVNGPLSNGISSFFSNGGGLDSLSIGINGDPTPFTLSNAIGTAQAVFQNKNLSSLSYFGQEGNFQLDLYTSGLFYLYADIGNLALSSMGTISAVDPPSATPLPPTLLLFAGGLLLLGLVASRRKLFVAAPAPFASAA